MRYVYLIVSFCLIFQSCKYWKHYNHDYSQNDEDLVRNRMSNYGDYGLNNEDIMLFNFSHYYVGYAKYQDDSYFIGYIAENREVKICRVFNRNWSKNETINKSIIQANDSLSNINLHIDTIYGKQDNDSVGVVILDIQGNPISNWDIADITDINDFKKYVLVKCFMENCPSLHLAHE